MTDREAIQKANLLRPNDIQDDIKAEWIYELESNFAELMEVDDPIPLWPEETELLMPSPHDKVYVLYLAAMIDNYNQETSLFANDSTISNQAIMEARSWWRRKHKPTERKITNVTS